MRILEKLWTIVYNLTKTKVPTKNIAKTCAHVPTDTNNFLSIV